MSMTFGNLLAELSLTDLYEMLGEAWIVQFVPQPGSGYCLESLAAIGKSEYDDFAAVRRDAIDLPLRHGPLDHMNRQVKMSASWPMPSHVMLAIAMKRNSAVLAMAPVAARAEPAGVSAVR